MQINFKKNNCVENYTIEVRMRLISSLSWVKKGASQTPLKVCLEKDEMKILFDELGAKEGDNEDESSDENASSNSRGDSPKSIDRKYNMDKYDEEGFDVKTFDFEELFRFLMPIRSSNV